MRKKQNGGWKVSDADWFYFSFMIRVDPSPILFCFNFFIRSESIRVDLTRTGGPHFSTCLAKMIVCPVPNISHVMKEWCRRASCLGRFTLWNNSRRRASHLGRFTSWSNGRRATQLRGRFTLWHYGRLATQLSFVAQQTLSFTTCR